MRLMAGQAVHAATAFTNDSGHSGSTGRPHHGIADARFSPYLSTVVLDENQLWQAPLPSVDTQIGTNGIGDNQHRVLLARLRSLHAIVRDRHCQPGFWIGKADAIASAGVA